MISPPAIRRQESRETSPPAPPLNPPAIAPQSPETKGSGANGPSGARGGAPVFTIIAVKNLGRQDQEDWWAAILADRVARTTLFSLRQDQKTFQYWTELAVWPGHDLNVVYLGPEAPDPQAGGHCAGPGNSGRSRKVAFFWVCQWAGQGAYLHFGFLSAGLPWKMEVGRYVLKILAQAGYSCLAGLTPAFNRHVVAYARTLGAKVMGRWPGVCYVADRDEFVDGVLLQFVLGPSAPDPLAGGQSSPGGLKWPRPEDKGD